MSRRWLGPLCGYCALLFGLLNAALGTAANVTLGWDPNPEPNIVSYRVHYGAQSGVYTNLVSAPVEARVTLEGLVRGTTYYFVVTAVDSENRESGPSNEVVYTVATEEPTSEKPGSTPQLSLKVVRGEFQLVVFGAPGMNLVIERSVDSVHWSTLDAFKMTTTFKVVRWPLLSDRQFFRLKEH